MLCETNRTSENKGKQMKAITIKQPPVGKLEWVFIIGDGRNQAMEGQPEKMKKTASLVLNKDSKEAKGLIAQIDATWEQYKTENHKIKAATQPKSLGYKAVKDKDTGAETNELSFTFSTNSMWPDGKPNNIKTYNSKGQQVDMGETIIGNGSLGVVHGSMGGYEYAGSFGISLYLTAVQVAKLVEGQGVEVDAADISAAGDFDHTEDGMPAVATGEQPAL